MSSFIVFSDFRTNKDGIFSIEISHIRIVKKIGCFVCKNI